MTNRDKFNRMSNSELASILIWTGATDRCKFCFYTRERCLGKSCFDSIKMWLSAPCANEPEKPSAEHVDLQEVSEKVCDNVNHPSHYTSGQIEVIDFIEDNDIYSFRKLFMWCKDNQKDWFRLLASSKTYIIKEYLKSRFWDLENADKVEYLTKAKSGTNTNSDERKD